MMPWLDMAFDAGYSGDEARQVARDLEEREMHRDAQERAYWAAAEAEHLAELEADLHELVGWVAAGLRTPGHDREGSR